MSPRGKKASARPPRRKAGRVAKRKPAKLKFIVNIDAQDMVVEYKAERSRSEYAHGQFEFRSPRKPSRGIPVSRSGYLCHFAPMSEIKAAGGPKSFARMFADAVVRGREGRKDSRQLSLF